MATEKLSQEELKVFGERLADARKFAGLGRLAAAKKLGVDRGLLERWEDGKLSEDQPMTRRGLATAMAAEAGVNPDEWFRGDYGFQRLATLEADLATALERLDALELLRDAERGAERDAQEDERRHPIDESDDQAGEGSG